MLIYKGPSTINSKPVRVILTNTDRPSKNPKTGDMAQVYILPERVNPVAAQRTGYDSAVCGDCPLRPRVSKGSTAQCYVTTIHGPNATWKAHRRAAVEFPPVLTKAVRLGAYGDPGAVVASVWRALVALAPRWTGYTHQWRTRADLRDLVMASVDTADDARTAQAAGWRTFRAKRAADPLLPGEIVCPASAEAGKRTTCAACGLCNGKQGDRDRRANIAINYH